MGLSSDAVLRSRGDLGGDGGRLVDACLLDWA